jgi:hypothetical protein
VSDVYQVLLWFVVLCSLVLLTVVIGLLLETVRDIAVSPRAKATEKVEPEVRPVGRPRKEVEQ